MAPKTGRLALKILFQGLNTENGLTPDQIAQLSNEKELLFLGSNSEEHTVFIVGFWACRLFRRRYGYADTTA